MRRRTRKFLRFTQYFFLVVGVIALGYFASEWAGSKFFQAKEAREFEQELQNANPAPAFKGLPRLQDGQTVGRLEIPRIGVSVMVVEGVGYGDLKRAAGHIPGTALPWQGGNVGIAAHRDTFFRPLQEIRANDTIQIKTLNGEYRYRVISTQVVKPSDVQVLNPSRGDVLTLVTCYPFYYIGAAPERFIVRAERSSGS